MSLIATGLGAVGGFWTIGKSIFTLGRQIKNQIYKRALQSTENEIYETGRVGRVQHYYNAMVDIDLELEAPTTRLFNRFASLSSLGGKLTKLFTGLGMLSDMIFFGVNLDNLLEDLIVNKDIVTDWQIGMDVVNAGISFAGVVTGKSLSHF